MANKPLVSNAKQALNEMKLEIANELGPLNLNLEQSNISFNKNEDIPGSLGAVMSKKLVQMGEEILLREYNNKNNIKFKF
ncbi:alpha/beta-type small acid-soluble spore protein [Paraclostridium sp. AKS81]|uniref:alpha/beta-type small acid-soluble spore protein n=1 Tax=Paraclostridium sp. AKS81 TaxID=2876117 RepID=UPI0021DF7750|nr:alpha/beta-type small acid-soluble spore protein [Paraclostridium sp. AKS81]MCU9813064.1 alpha/beta-type small acid-soluble spore protein [Paraclostridium sp. AKS81]